MLLTIRHGTIYRYAHPVALLPHRMMMRPRGQQDLRVLHFDLACSPSGEIEWTQDVFGNLVATASFARAAETLAITGTMLVELSADPWPVFAIAPEAHSFPFAYSDEDIVDLGALRAPRHADPDGRLRAWVRSFIASDPTDTLALLKDLNAGILPLVLYRQRDEEGTQTPLETLDLASGSCRDIATLFIEAVRHLGLGARAVSGYLFDPDDNGQHGSTHAWAEVYLPCAGWIVFDPTNARIGAANLVPAAVGRDITQIMPVDGHYAGAPEDFIAMSVDVVVSQATSDTDALSSPAPKIG